jgi:outer membrane protein assembly factor BamB
MRIAPVLLLLMLGGLSQAEDWPRFRGPNGTGTNLTARNLPVEFGPGRNVVWKAAIPFAKSSPIVAGGRVFLTAIEGNSMVVLALDAGTGRALWRRELARTRKQETYRLNEPASPTPVADESGVYAFFPEFGLVAFSRDGVERWRHPLGPFKNYYGMAGSPIVAGDLVILNCDQQAGSFLIAVDKKTGARRWRTERANVLFGWTTPILYTPPGGPPQVIVVSSDRVDSFQVATGERRWWFPIASTGANGSPMVVGDTFYVHVLGQDQPTMPLFPAVAARYDVNKDGRVSKDEFAKDDWFEHFPWLDGNANAFLEPDEWNKARLLGVGTNGMLAVKLGAEGRLPDSAIQWSFKRNVPFVPAPVLAGGTLFMVKDGGIVTSLDPETGALIKQGRAGAALGTYYSSPVTADGKMFLLNEEGKLAVLSAQGEWQVLAVNDLGEEAYATPAIAGNRLYVRTRGSLYCFGLK